jgi:UDP-2,3-diacylglucosamine pyrophosphatase LpxH
MIVKKHAKNIHEIQLDGKQVKIAMLSDLHWDNPKCDWKILKRDLDYCVENNIPIMVNGDFFCLMQGRGDRRGNKSDIRPEHNNAKYLDSIVETAVEWWSPYAHLLTVIGYGNHETAIIKYQETDILQRFVDLLNYKNGTQVYAGGYGGWIVVRQDIGNGISSSFKIKYFHGSGGGGVVTKGALNLTRALEMYEDFDVFTMGHIHENAARNDVRDTIDYNNKIGYRHEHKQIHMMLTGTYKEEYGDGSKGWHVERGAPVKPTGGRILVFESERFERDGQRKMYKNIDSMKFPL